MKTNRFLMIVIIGLIITSCAPSPEAIQKAIEATQNAAPTATQIPLSDIDLSVLIFEDGDLPPGYSESQVRSELGDVTKRAPLPISWFSQALQKGSGLGGIVSILVYEKDEDLTSAYNSIIENLINTDPSDPGIGDSSLTTSQFMFMNGTVDVTFKKCTYVVHMQFMGTIIKSDVESYAKRLEQRLSEKLCR